MYKSRCGVLPERGVSGDQVWGGDWKRGGDGEKGERREERGKRGKREGGSHSLGAVSLET